jgi:phosphoglycolate phosphatase
VTEPRAVVFDLDGTLVDSRRDIVGGVEVALRRHGVTPPPSDVIAGFVGDGARLLVARSLGFGHDDARVEPVLATYLDYYAAHPVEHTAAMPGALAALAALAMPLAVCTNKPRAVTAGVLAHFGWASRFGVVVAGGDVTHNKPHPEPLLRIAEQLGLSAADLVMVGDGVQDVECGRAAGARTVAVLGGFGSEEKLSAARPDRLIATLFELPGALAELS